MPAKPEELAHLAGDGIIWIHWIGFMFTDNTTKRIDAGRLWDIIGFLPSFYNLFTQGTLYKLIDFSLICKNIVFRNCLSTKY